jgi:hypothetical protein
LFRRIEETDQETCKALRRGWFLGSESFKREALARMEGSLGGHHAGELHREVAQAKAERIVAEELQRQGWQPDDLVTRRKNDPAKLAIAARLRRETTLPLKAIAARVHLGTSKTANTKLHKYMRGAPANDSSPAPLVIGTDEITKTSQTMG